MIANEIRIGSRGSALALAQARLVVDALEREGRPTRIVIVETDGDRRAPDTAWGEGAFVAAIERALLDGRVDVAVHSAKDVPTDQDPRLRIAAYLPRADPRDALVVRNDATQRRIADLPAGTRVGTDSPRRTGFLLAERPDLIVHPLHGNVDTRLRRLDGGETDALVLACAGLDRLGLGDRIVERIEPETIPPAPGQGAIAVQIRRDDAAMLASATAIDDRTTRRAVEAERAFLSASGGGCRAPIGALATVAGDELDLLGGWVSPDGSDKVVSNRRAPVGDGEHLARELAADFGSRTGLRPTVGHDQTALPR
ncbi:MAG TPA: hydroxymethylbilane synthase [Candidatus Limnocylindrales bacterium]